MATLTIDGYNKMALVAHRGEFGAFNAWLEAQDLKDEGVVQLTFGEGYADAICCDRDDEGKWYVGPDGVVVTVPKSFALRTPPPAFVFDYCE